MPPLIRHNDDVLTARLESLEKSLDETRLSIDKRHEENRQALEDIRKRADIISDGTSRLLGLAAAWHTPADCPTAIDHESRLRILETFNAQARGRHSLLTAIWGGIGAMMGAGSSYIIKWLAWLLHLR